MSQQSIEPTYDSRQTGPRYHVTTRIDNRTIALHHPIADPFVRQTVTIGWRDLLHGLIRRGLEVVVIVGGDRQIVNDVLELDNNALVPGRTRRDEFDVSLGASIATFLAASSTPTGDADG